MDQLSTTTWKRRTSQLYTIDPAVTLKFCCGNLGPGIHVDFTCTQKHPNTVHLLLAMTVDAGLCVQSFSFMPPQVKSGPWILPRPDLFWHIQRMHKVLQQNIAL